MESMNLGTSNHPTDKCPNAWTNVYNEIIFVHDDWVDLMTDIAVAAADASRQDTSPWPPEEDYEDGRTDPWYMDDSWGDYDNGEDAAPYAQGGIS